MTARVHSRRPGIDHHGAGRDRGFERIIGLPRRQMKAVKNLGSFLVDSFHAGEVRGRLRLAGENTLDELVLTPDAERPIEASLVAKCGRRNGADAFAACRAGAVAGPYLQPVIQRGELLQTSPQRSRARLHRSRIVRRALQQVGPPDITDKDEISGDCRNRFVGRGAVGDQERQMLRGMTGRVPHIEEDIADGDAIAVMQQLVMLW